VSARTQRRPAQDATRSSRSPRCETAKFSACPASGMVEIEDDAVGPHFRGPARTLIALGILRHQHRADVTRLLGDRIEVDLIERLGIDRAVTLLGRNADALFVVHLEPGERRFECFEDFAAALRVEERLPPTLVSAYSRRPASACIRSRPHVHVRSR